MKSKKRTKIVLAINSLVSTSHPAYSNHIQLMFRLGRSYPDLDVCLFNPSRMSIDRMKNAAADIALETQSDYLLILDDDVIVPMDCLKKLIAADGDIVAGNVLIRGYPFEPMIFKYRGNKGGLAPLKKMPKVPGVIDVDAIGFSLCLIKTSLLKKIPKPFFVTGMTNTEDVYFCLKARYTDKKCTIKADTSIVCHHVLWHELISVANKDNYKKYYEAQFPEECAAKNASGDRGDSYLASVEGVLNAG